MPKKDHPKDTDSIKDFQENDVEQDICSEDTETNDTTQVDDDPVAVLMREKEELKNAYLRLSADMDNYRKRIQKEKEDFQKFAVKNLVENLLPILDNLDRSLKAQNIDVDSLKTGVGMVFSQFEGVLSESGLEKVTLQPGDEFDPQFAEAVIMEENSEASFPLTVAEVYETGWKIGNSILRTAKVKVYKNN
ncbi:MAG: nucleotide exchange factor GrpE [Brevinema sp.]